MRNMQLVILRQIWKIVQYIARNSNDLGGSRCRSMTNIGSDDIKYTSLGARWVTSDGTREYSSANA